MRILMKRLVAKDSLQLHDALKNERLGDSIRPGWHSFLEVSRFVSQMSHTGREVGPYHHQIVISGIYLHLH